MACGQVINEPDRIRVGAERYELYGELLEGKRVAMVVNHSSLVDGEHLVDNLIDKGVDLVKVFAPEHGFRGTADAGEKVVDAADAKSGLQVVSLYGAKRKPEAADLFDIDIVLFDIQDVGVRFYTYISTMHLVMEACAENDIPVVVLDRPNPNGHYIDGPVLEEDYRSFVGMHRIPVVYGMTIGELARMIDGEKWLANGVDCDLTVIPCEGYSHSDLYELPVAPSPNLPNLRSILLYPSLCFFEGTIVSVGRGTNTQFQVIGHPDFAIGSYVFTPTSMPGAHNPRYEGEEVFGTYLADRDVDDLHDVARLELSYLINYYGYFKDSEFFLKNGFFNKLAGTDKLRTQIEGGMTEEEIRASWMPGIERFKSVRKQYLLYP